MTFRVGQKVVCVHDESTVPGYHWYSDESPPVKGSIYTVAATGLRSLIGTPCVALVEIRRPDGYFYGEWRFRPIVERKTSIEIFTRMLTPAPQKESAR